MTSSIFDQPEFNDTLFYPGGDVSSPPPGARDVYVNVPGARLHVRVYATGTGLRTLLLFHGNGEVIADYDDSAERFARAGVELSVADYRGYGASTGTPTLRGLVDDARAIADAIRPSIVMGRSLGGVAAHELYARPVPGTTAVVLESSFSDLGALIGRRGLVPPARFTSDETDRFDPIPKLREGRLPLLVLHGERDTLIVPAEARAAHAAAGSAYKQLAFVPDRGHNDISQSPAYWDALAAFVART